MTTDEAAPQFGERPLAQTIAAAGAIRRLCGLLLALEHDNPTVATMLSRFTEWERELAAVASPDPTPRIGAEATETQRLYLSHAFDIGAFNPCFPEYRFEHLGTDTGSGTVSFPLVFEGPPGLVHGGFLGVFFDCVTQHHNCAAGLSGKTRSLQVTFRRPTPILTELRFDIMRSEIERGIKSTARLLLGDEVLCTGELTTLALPPDRLAGHRYAKRRSGGQ